MRIDSPSPNSNSELESVYAFKRRSRSLSSRPPSPIRQCFLKQRFTGLIERSKAKYVASSKKASVKFVRVGYRPSRLRAAEVASSCFDSTSSSSTPHSGNAWAESSRKPGPTCDEALRAARRQTRGKTPGPRKDDGCCCSTWTSSL